ncbi:putative signal transduction protein with CBS domains [Thermobispora bispora DSM 43833]|jgi:CBS domain-containing protein|uniref:Putative signal transduction protein with CBS domains n=2 Tax=Thermobispora bispora TaxID=2006 RepID=D6Y906_THEBD|nr:putative signal transduction protein with CBS domains [Thermobispora bispora DSM 43833]
MGTGSMRKTARDVMHRGVQCVGEHDSLRRAAQMMRDLNVGALPICGEDDRLKGIITDRDIVVKCCAEGVDLDRTTVGQCAQGSLIWVDAQCSVEEALQKMEQHQIKRLPVIENKRLVGMISEADLAKELPDDMLAEFVHRVYATT